MPSSLYQDTPLADKERLLAEVEADPRFPTYFFGCFECGVCVAACPSARFYDFSPRQITQAIARQDAELVYEQFNDDIWNCSQCFSCTRCPRGNSPGGLVTIMREVAVRRGLPTMKRALAGYTRVVFKIMTTGVQVTPDMLQPEAFPDWGPRVRQVAEQLALLRQELPADTMRTTRLAWLVDERATRELYAIWKLTGCLDLIAAVDPALHDIMVDVMDDALDQGGIAVD